MRDPITRPIRVLLATVVLTWVTGEARAPSAFQSTMRVFTTRAIRTVLDHIGPQFEQQHGVRLEIISDVAAPMVRRVRSGEAFDLLVAAPEQIEALVKENLIIPETRVALARSAIGVAVHADANPPDISSVDAFTRALLNAKSVGYLKEGQSGVYIAQLLRELSLDAAIAHKVIRPERDVVSELVAQKQLELGIVVVTQILTTPGVKLAGPLPDAIQRYVTFAAGISARSRSVAAAQQLLAALRAPAAHAVMRTQGMEPVVQR